jgi:RNA recognition motif-containing protein
MSIYVGNLSYEVTQEDLSAAFAEYGSVKRVQLPTDRETGRMRGFAFVEMDTEWMGRNLKVNKAKPREDRSSFGGNRRGNFSSRY